MSPTLVLLLALVAQPCDDPLVVSAGEGSSEVVADDLEARLDRALERFRKARDGLLRARADDAVLRAAFQPVWLELAEAGSGRAAATALRHRVEGAADTQTRALYQKLAPFAGERWLVDDEYAVFTSLRRDAEAIGRDRAVRLAGHFRRNAPDLEQEATALLLAAQLQEDGHVAEPARKQSAVELHREVMERFAGTQAAQESAAALWRLERLQVGKLAPDFVTRDVAGNEMRLSHYGRKVIVVEFYSFSDPGIVSRMAHRRALFERYRESRFTLIGINLDAEPIAFRRTLEEHEIEWPNSFEGGPDVRTLWKVRRGPIHFVLDRDRVIQHVGSDDKELDAVVAKLLAGVSAKATQGAAEGQERQP
jgi:peroxiredoxin